MITDKLCNAHLYYGCHPGFQKAFDFLIQNSNPEPGRYEIDGDRIYATRQTCKLSGEGSGSFEAHRNFIDIQYIVRSGESFRYAHADTLSELTSYDEKKDAQRFLGDGSVITLREGDFIVLFPDDAHLACISPTEDGVSSEKIVVKVAASF
jgi:biofilm protein TabA